jgi:hypothetical protein
VSASRQTAISSSAVRKGWEEEHSLNSIVMSTSLLCAYLALGQWVWGNATAQRQGRASVFKSNGMPGRDGLRTVPVVLQGTAHVVVGDHIPGHQQEVVLHNAELVHLAQRIPDRDRAGARHRPAVRPGGCRSAGTHPGDERGRTAGLKWSPPSCFGTKRRLAPQREPGSRGGVELAGAHAGRASHRSEVPANRPSLPTLIMSAWEQHTTKVFSTPLAARNSAGEGGR